jgi:MFS transporter, ACS family, aldohexuronate transporter
LRNSAITRLGILTLAHVVGNMQLVSVMAIAPILQRDLDLSVTQVGLLISAWSGAHGLAAIPAGAVVDRVGVGWALVLAHAILAASAVGLSLASGAPSAMVATAAMGLGYSLTNPASARGVLEWFEPRRRATAMGIKQTGVSISGVFAAAFGALAIWLDWRVIFLIIAVLTVANGLLCLRLVEPARATSERRTSGALAGLREIVTDRNMRALIASGCLFNVGQQSFVTYLTLFLREAAQASQPMAALALAVAQGASAVGRIGWGMLSDTFFRGRRKPTVVLLCGSAVVFLAVLAAVGPSTGLALGLALALLLGLTIGSFPPLTQTLAVEAVELRLAGSAMGYILMGNSLGSMVGPLIFGLVVDLTGTYASGWLITAALVLCGTAILARRFREGGSSLARLSG